MRALKWLAFFLVVLALGGLLTAGWHYSDVLRQDALLVQPAEPPTFDLEVLAADGRAVTLPRTDGTVKAGVWGLQWNEGYGQVGLVTELGSAEVSREFRLLRGSLGEGRPVRLDKYAFPRDPRRGLGLDFRQVRYPSELGRLSAWLVEGSSRTWVIFVHGRTAERREALRMLGGVAEAGHPALVISYRNDPGAPASPDGFYRFGHTEWRDLEASVAYAVEAGARRVVLVGYSMGGAIVSNFLYQSSLANRVWGVVLDAPVLDFGATVDLGAKQRGVPSFLTTVAKAISSARFGINWSGLNYAARAGELETPVLLFHGDGDETVPVETSRALAAARPDLVTYLEVPDAGHGEAWNLDPEPYRQAVADFLKRVTG